MVPERRMHCLPWRPIFRAAALVAFDGIWLSQGIITFIVAVWLLVVTLPMSFLPRNLPHRADRFRSLGIYGVAIACVLGLCAYNVYIGGERARLVVAAVEAFKGDTGLWPRELSELVPVYLPAVPRARYAIAMSDFSYRYAGGQPILFYTAIPPFGRPFYAFEERRWGYLD